MRQKGRVRLFVAMVLTALLFVLIYLPGSSSFSINKVSPVIQAGHLDLSNLDFAEEQKLYLGGDWEFYPMALLVSNGDIYNKKPLMISMPGYWDVWNSRIARTTGGYGSLRTTISGLSDGQSIAVLLLNNHGAYRAYLDGTLISGKGVISKDLDSVSSKGDLQLFYHRIQGSQKEHELVIEYASSSLSGVDTTPILMSYSEAKSYISQVAVADIVMSTVLVMSFLILTVYYLVMRRQGIYNLLLLLTLTISLRYFIANSHSLFSNHELTHIQSNYCGIIIVLLTFLIKIMGAVYFREEMKLDISRKALWGFTLFYGILFIFYLFISPSLYNAYLNKVFLWLSYCINAYVLYKMYPYVKEGRPFWSLYSGMYVLLTTSCTMESYYYSGYLHSDLNTFAPVCVVALVFMFIYITAKRMSSFYAMEIDMMKMQEDLNHNQISLMMSQIRPHFLYNALTAIQCLCKTDPSKAEEALLKFAKYLRANLASINSKEYILFSEELNHIDNYLQIEKLRFGDKLEILYDIEESNFMVPLLSIQPIVENAVKHGISKRPQGGHILISCHVRPDCYEILVEDDGVGFDTSKALDEKSYGLRNIRQRIQAMGQSTLIIQSRIGKGTQVIVQIKNN